MTKTEIKAIQAAQTVWLNAHTAKLWDGYCEIFPRLVRYNPPKIVLNNRLTRTAGRCFQSENVIDLAAKFFVKNKAEMLRTILVHEIAHQIDFNLYGESELKCGHGKMWVKTMVELGLPANKFHSLEL
jgi:predicted SprT family Zn-dependent metalloprotease